MPPVSSTTPKMSHEEIARLIVRPNVPAYRNHKANFLVVLFDPTPAREETARQLVEVGGWPVLPVDSGRAEQLGPAVDAILTDHAKGGPFAPSGVVLEAFHPLRHPDQPSQGYPDLPAKEIVNWLTAHHVFDFVPFLLYTAETPALAEARLLPGAVVALGWRGSKPAWNAAPPPNRS